MHLMDRRTRVTVLILLCILFWGMCFGNMQTDSSFACTESAGSGLEDRDASASPASVLRPVGKPAPAAQAYGQKVLNQCEDTLVLRHHIRRASPRPGRGGSFLFVLISVISLFFPLFFVVRTHVDFHEIYSNTVIIRYIHHKDGQKS